MNKLLYTLSVLLVLLLAGCNKEDDVHAELGDSWYDLKDDPSDGITVLISRRKIISGLWPRSRHLIC